MLIHRINRYKQVRTLQKKSNNEYELYAPSSYIRSNDVGDIDFEGGPYISIGEDLSYFGIDEIVVSIDKELASDKYIIKTKQLW